MIDKGFYIQLLTFTLALLVTPAGATTFHINRGTTWHVGNSNMHRNTPEFQDATGKVGPTWVQAFKLSEDDRVEVEIAHVGALDSRAGQRSLVFINDEPLGEFTGGDYQSYHSSRSLDLKGGRNYNLKITALGNEKGDDFAFEDVIVRTTGGADLTLTGPPTILTNLLPVAGA